MFLIFQTNWQHLMTLNAQLFFLSFFFFFLREAVMEPPMRRHWVGCQNISASSCTSLSLQSPAQVLLPGLDDMETLRESKNKWLLTGALDSGQERPGAASVFLSLRAQRLDMPHSKLFQRPRPALSCSSSSLIIGSYSTWRSEGSTTRFLLAGWLSAVFPGPSFVPSKVGAQ